MRSLPATNHVVQWGDADVWKVGGKVFAIGRGNADGTLAITFKVSPLAYDILKDMPGCTPAPYFASRGMKWIRRTDPRSLNNRGLQEYITASYNLAVDRLTKKQRSELGLDSSPA